MGFQDAKNLAWKVAAVAKGDMHRKLLDSYELERHGVEKKICAAIEKGQKIASNRNPVAFFMRGRGQRIAPLLVGANPSALKYASQAAWSYDTSPLSIEHWERPPASFRSLCPAGGYRRRQNVFRWISERTRAGDAAPEALFDGLSINTWCKRASGGFTLLLFEGNAEDNAELESHVATTQILSKDCLEQLGEDLKIQSLPISIVLVFPAGHEAQKPFGVKGQCLFLLRPDHHIALRSEPIRKGVVQRYFKQVCGMSLVVASAPSSAALFDPLPALIWSSALCVCSASWVAAGMNGTLPWKVAFAFILLSLAFVFWASSPPR